MGYSTTCKTYQEEWDQYKAIVNGRVTQDDYYDLSGNYEQYNDGTFSLYLADSVQKKTQLSFTKVSPYGRKYHFLGIKTADNTGSSFSLFSPYGDHAGLDANELSFIGAELAANSDSALTMVFGHHPLASTGNSQQTCLLRSERTSEPYGHLLLRVVRLRAHPRI